MYGLFLSWKVEDDVAENTLIEVFESALFCGSTVPYSFPGYGGEWRSDGGELWKELVVKATETEE